MKSETVKFQEFLNRLGMNIRAEPCSVEGGPGGLADLLAGRIRFKILVSVEVLRLVEPTDEAAMLRTLRLNAAQELRECADALEEYEA